MQQHFKVEIDGTGQIHLKRLVDWFVPLGEHEWKKHFEYNNKTFFLINNTWHGLMRAVAFLKKHCRVEFDEAFFRAHFNVSEGDLARIEAEAKYLELEVEVDRMYYYFKEGFEKYAAFEQIHDFKMWSFPQKFVDRDSGRLTEREVTIRHVKFEPEKSLSTKKTVFSTLTGFSTLFFSYLRSKGFVFTEPVAQTETIPVRLNTDTAARDYQTGAVDAWFQKGVGIIVAPTASGKTYMGAMAIARTKVKTLILVHKKDIIGQWKANLVQLLNVQKTDIGLFAAGKKELDAKIIIASYQTLIKNPKAIKTMRIGLVIADECHHVPATTFQKVNDCVNCKYKLGLTATPNRPDKKDGGLYAFYHKIVYNLKAEDLLEDKYISPTIFYTFYTRDPGISATITRMEDDGHKPSSIQNVVRELSSQSEAKLEALEALLQKINEHRLGYIIFADRIQAAERISKDFNIPFLSADLSAQKRDELFRRMREKEIPGIVTAKLAGEGVDIPGLDVVIDLIPSASETVTLQKLGRVRRRTEKKSIGFYIQFVLEDVKQEERWANAAYSHFFNDTGRGVFKKRRVVYFVGNIKFGIKRSAKATERTREHRIKMGDKTEQELLEFLKTNPGTYLYEISKKLDWSRGKVACALDRLENKGLIKKNDYLKTREPTKIKVHGDVTVFFDGACTVNPGGITSCGFCVYDSQRRIHKESILVGTDPDLTNNYAEYAGLCAALNWLLEHGITNNITIKGDSQLVIDQMNGIKAARGGVYIELFEEASLLAKKFQNLKFEWIPGDTNTEAHVLSKQPYELNNTVINRNLTALPINRRLNRTLTQK